MKLNKSGGDMYENTQTTNPLAGKCPHECSYCYVEKLRKIKAIDEKYTGPIRLCEHTLKGKTGSGHKIFVCSMSDLFGGEWEVNRLDIIQQILEACRDYPDNTYIFQTKNPQQLWAHIGKLTFPKRTEIGTTVETNRIALTENVSKAPSPRQRAWAMRSIKEAVFGYDRAKAQIPRTIKTFITIEPIMAFDLDEMVDLIKASGVDYVNIGADSRLESERDLPEPTGPEVIDLILELQRFTKVVLKKNIRRLFE